MTTAFALFAFPKDKSSAIDSVLTDELVNRQSITVRDGSALGLDPAKRYLLLEGTPTALSRARELIPDRGGTEITGDDAAKARQAISAQEESSAVGVGMIFDV